jgi:hypothetical protein
MPICKYLSVSISAKRHRQTTDLFLKKSGSVLRKNTQVKYAMNKHNENDLAEGMMCLLLSISRSDYYRWRSQQVSGKDQANQSNKTDF